MKGATFSGNGVGVGAVTEVGVAGTGVAVGAIVGGIVAVGGLTDMGVFVGVGVGSGLAPQPANSAEKATINQK